MDAKNFLFHIKAKAKLNSPDAIELEAIRENNGFFFIFSGFSLFMNKVKQQLELKIKFNLKLPHFPLWSPQFGPIVVAGIPSPLKAVFVPWHSNPPCKRGHQAAVALDNWPQVNAGIGQRQ